MTLKRLVLDYRSGELVIRCLYRRGLEDAPGPSTKRREREVAELTREGLRQALASLEGRVDVVGTSGYQLREDVILATTSSDALETVGQVKGA
jgi:hypothetical protein